MGVVVVSGGGTLVTSALATEAGETAELDLAHHHSNADSRWNWCSGTKTECLINFNGCAQGLGKVTRNSAWCSSTLTLARRTEPDEDSGLNHTLKKHNRKRMSSFTPKIQQSVCLLKARKEQKKMTKRLFNYHFNYSIMVFAEEVLLQCFVFTFLKGPIRS